MEGLNQNERKRKLVSNVRKLAVIRLRQCRNLYLEAVLFLGLAVVLDFVNFFMKYQNNFGRKNIYGIGELPLCAAIFLAAVFGLGSYNILGDGRLSMYPGTVASRFCARLCSDYLVFLGATVVYGGFYGINSLILHVFARKEIYLDVRNTFSWNYLGAGMLQMFCACLFMYSLLVLIYSFFTKIGIVFASVFTVAVIIVANVLIYIKKLNLYKVWDLLVGKGMALGSYLAFLLSVWAVFTVLAFIIAFRVGNYRKASCFLLWVVVAGVFLGGSSCIRPTKSVYVYEASYFRGDEKYLFLDKDAKKDFLFQYTDFKQGKKIMENIANGKILRREDGDWILVATPRVLTEKEAKEEGCLEEGFSLKENQMLYRVAASDLAYKNRHIYENMVKSLTIYQEGTDIFWERERCGNVISSAFGMDYEKCQDTDYDISRYLKRWWGDDFQSVLVVEDALAKKWQQDNDNAMY